MGEKSWNGISSHAVFCGWVIWIFIIVVLTTAPWSSYRGHSHWEHVSWVPFSDVSLSLFSVLEVLANMALFIPLGGLLVLWYSTSFRKAMWYSVGIGLFLSCSIELFQVYCHDHFPTLTDVTSNVLGTLLGAQFMQWIK